MWPQTQDWVRVWATIMPMQHVPGLVLLQPLHGGAAHIRRARGALRGQRVSRQVILSTPHQLPAVSGFYLWALTLLSLHADTYSWQAVFLVSQLCFLFNGRGLSHKMLLYSWAVSAEGWWSFDLSVSQHLSLCFDRHEIVTSHPPSLIDMASLISFY